MPRTTYTISEIAETLGATWHQVHQAIRRLGVEPCERRGGTRMFQASTLGSVRKWLESHARRELVAADSS